MKKYDNYKDSRVEWIGKIPTEWEIKKLKYCIDSNIGGFWGEEPKENENDIGCIRVSEFIKENGVLKNTELTKRNICKSKFNQIKVQKGSILIEKSGGGETCLVGNAVIVNDDLNAIYSNFITKIEVKNQYNSFFINYMLRCMYLKKINYLCINQTTGIQNLNVPKYLSTYIPIPSIKEQNEIVRYLDGKISNIDNLINKKEELIETLKISRQKLVSETVTKGINKDAEMKDSGVEWIGEIPKEWDVKKVKYLISNEKNAIKPGPFGSDLKSSDIVSEGVKVYTQQNVINRNANIGFDFVSQKKYNELKNFKVKEGDFLLSSRGTIGKVYQLPAGSIEGIVHPCLIKFNIDSQFVNPNLIEYIFNNSDIIQNQIKYMSNSTIIDVIYSDTLKNLKLPIGRVDEQAQIVSYLDKRTSQIDKLISKTEEQIEVLKKAKQKLITEVVTGKIDVRDYKLG